MERGVSIVNGVLARKEDRLNALTLLDISKLSLEGCPTDRGIVVESNTS